MEEQRNRRPWNLWLMTGLAATVAYFMSIGPAEYLDSRSLLTSTVYDALVVFYTPLRLVHENSIQPIRDTMDWYIDLWTP
jgi:hypothetical protein